MLTRRDFIRRLAGASLLATPAGTALLTPAACGSRASRPNVVLILVDDHAHDALGYSGRYPFLETPNIDRLAAQGIQFRNSFVTTALCVPSRASLQTGCYVSRHGVTRNSTPKEPGFQFGRLPTLPDVLHDNDYDTAFIGKWHLGSGEPFRAFDYWASLRWQGNYNKNWLNVNGQGIFEEEYVTDLLTRYAVRWLLQDATDSPFFLMLSHKAVHSPFVPAPRHAGRYATASLPMPANYLDDLADKHPVVRQRPCTRVSRSGKGASSRTSRFHPALRQSPGRRTTRTDWTICAASYRSMKASVAYSTRWTRQGVPTTPGYCSRVIRASSWANISSSERT